MTWSIHTYPDAKPSVFGGHTLPLLLEDGPLPVMLVDGIPANYRIQDENGERPKAHVILSLYSIEGSAPHSIHLTSYNQGQYAIDLIDNDPKAYETLEGLLDGLKGHIDHAKTAAKHIPALREEMKAAVSRFNAEVSPAAGREGYERVCYMYGVKPKPDEEILNDGFPLYGPLNDLRYPDWNRHEVYEKAINSSRCWVLRLEARLHIGDTRCRCNFCAPG